MTSMNNSSDRSSSLFSPLPSHQSTPGQSYTPTPSQHTLTASQDPTPLTISAHDIDGGSKDFTEYTNLDISSLNSTKTSTNKENALTTPKTTPTVSIRVRVSAKKLREIQSPYDSSSSSLEGKSPLLHSMIEPGRHSFQPTHPHTSQASPLLVGGGQERAEERTALTPQRERIIQRKVNLIGNTDQDTQAGTKKVSLRQGVLQTRPDSTDPQDISSDSVLIQNEVSTEQCTAQASRDKLLYWKSQDVGTSRAKAVYHVQPVGLPDSQKSHVVISDVVQAADQKIKMSENQNRLREDGQFRFHEETAKLVATCTAAATAALLGTHQNPVKLMGRPSGSKVQSPPGQAASDVTSHEPERLSPTPVDQTDYVKTNGAQNHTNWAHSQNNQDVRSKPTKNNTFFTNRPNNITPLGSHYRARPPSSPGRTAQEWRDTPPQYSDLVTRVNRMEELQHSRLLTMDKVVMDTDKPLFKDNHANRNPVFKDNHANRNPCPGKRVFSLVKNEYCQTSPLGGLPLTKLSAPLAHISTPSIGIDVDTEGATEESGASFTGMSVRNSKENTRLPSSSTHLSHMPVTRPLLHDPPQSVRLEEDGVWSVAKVLSDVQQARADIDLQCALTEAQEQYTDLGELLQSMEYSEEFRDVSYKVAQLLESARTNQETAVTSRDLHVEMPKAMSVTRVKPDAMGRQRKEAIKTGRAHKVSNQETRQKPIATGKMTSIKPRVSARVTTPKLRPSQIKKTSYHHPLKKVSFTTSTAPHADTPTTAPHPNAPTTSTASHPHAPTTSATPHSHSVPTQLNQWPVVIPIGPPCVIPSPIYTLHDPLHRSRPPTQCDKFTSTHAPPHGADTKKSVATTADACLQTSLSHDTEETGSSALDELLMKEQGVVDVSKMDNTVEDISNESSGGLEESREENLQAVDPSELSSTGSVESALTILGQHPPTPPPSQPPPPRPSHHTQCVRECASEELNEQLQERLESRAVEWLRQELTMRMLSQMKPLGDSGSNTPSISNSCSTCSIDSLNKLTDAAKLAPSYTGPEDNTVVFSAVKEAIRLELLSFAREMTGAMETIPATEQRAAEDTDDQYSYTPPESFTSSLSDRDSLSTPHPTPPLSISPTPDDTLTCEGVGLISTPPLTPPHNESRPHSPTIALQTPQVSADEESSVSESVHKTISVFSDRTVTTPQATPIPPPISVGSPPRSLTEPVTPLTQQHTKELNTSEDTSTTSNDISSTPSHDHTLTSSTSSTDRAISMGECIQTKFHLPHANSSLSEGEVPLSPGDIRWGALFSKVDPTVEAFLELKHSGDSFSGSEDTCHSQSQEFSVGEVGRTKVICVGPFEKFLTNINTSTPDDSSSCTREGSSVENTLSELTSINLDPLAPDITPILTQVRRHKPAGKNKGSPGEVLSLRTKDKRENSSISFPHSEGEVPKRLKARKNRPHVIETSQFDVSVDNTNEIRNGIDVISLSRLSSSKLQDKEESRLDDDTLQSISQISVKSSPVEAGMPKLLLVQPTYAHKEEQATGNEMPSVTYSDRQPSPKTLTFSSSEDLHMQNINLSELELTDTVSKQDNKEAVEAPTPPLPSPHRTTINVTVPVASEELTDFRSSDSYSSDFDFTSSVSIPGID